MLRSLWGLLRAPNTEVGAIDEVLNNLSYPSVFNERLDPDGHDIITLLLDKGPADNVACLRLLKTVTSKTGFKPANPDYNGQTPVFYAARDGRLEVLKFLHDSLTYALETVDRFGQTAAFYAAREGRIDVLEYLKDKAGQETLNAKDKNGQTPIFYACERNQVAAVKWLVEQGGVDPELRDNMRRTARNYATNPEILKFFTARNKETSSSKKRKIEQVPQWVNLTKDVLRVSGVMNKFPSDLAHVRRALERGDFEDFQSFYDRVQSVLKTAPDVHDYFLQLAFATGLAKQ